MCSWSSSTGAPKGQKRWWYVGSHACKMAGEVTRPKKITNKASVEETLDAHSVLPCRLSSTGAHLYPRTTFHDCWHRLVCGPSMQHGDRSCGSRVTDTNLRTSHNDTKHRHENRATPQVRFSTCHLRCDEVFVFFVQGDGHHMRDC